MDKGGSLCEVIDSTLSEEGENDTRGPPLLNTDSMQFFMRIYSVVSKM